jgi:hypothetical protein
LPVYAEFPVSTVRDLPMKASILLLSGVCALTTSMGPAKFAAALMASGSPNPVLLRVDLNSGHGHGSTRSQTDLLVTDWIAFIKWRAGVPGWRPDFGKKRP